MHSGSAMPNRRERKQHGANADVGRRSFTDIPTPRTLHNGVRICRSDRICWSIASRSSRSSTSASKGMPWCHWERNRWTISGNHTLCASPAAMQNYCSAAPSCQGCRRPIRRYAIRPWVRCQFGHSRRTGCVVCSRGIVPWFGLRHGRGETESARVPLQHHDRDGRRCAAYATCGIAP